MANESERPHQDLPDPATAERTDGPRIADPHHDEPRETAAAAQDAMVAEFHSSVRVFDRNDRNCVRAYWFAMFGVGSSTTGWKLWSVSAAKWVALTAAFLIATR